MRTARRAGPTEATTVTPMPTARETRTVRASNTSGPDGRSMPKALRSSFSRKAARTPKPIPITEEMAPTMAASVSTERNTCRRLAPTTRKTPTPGCAARR